MQLKPPPVFAELDHNDAMQGLTSQQQLFVSHVFSGMTYSEAFRAAGYGAGLSTAYLGQRARELANSPLVSAKLKDLVSKRDEASTLAPLLTRQWITQGIMDIAERGDKDSTRLAALIALGKVRGIDLFSKADAEDQKPRSVADIDAELTAALRSMTPVIEGDARHVAAPAHKPGDRRRKPRA